MSTDSEPSPASAPARASRRRRLAIAAAALLVLYAVFGYAIVPRIVASQLVAQVESLTGRVATVEHVAFDPFRMRLELEGVALPDASPTAPPVVAFDAFRVDVHVPSLLIGDVALEEVSLEGPRIEVVIDEAGTLNLTQLLLPTDPQAAAEEPADPPPAEESDLVVDVESIRIVRSEIRFTDRSQSPPFETAIAPLDLELDGFTTRAGGQAPYTLALQIGDRTRLDWTGTIGLDPIRSEGTITLADFDLRLPWDFLSERLRFEVAGGGVGLTADYVLELDERVRFDVEDARVAIDGLVLHDVAAPPDEGRFLTVASLAVSGISLAGDDAGLARLAVGAVELDGAELKVARKEDGTIDLATLFEVAPAVGPADERDAAAAVLSAADEVEEVVVDELASAVVPEDAASDARSSPEPEIRVERVAARDLAVAFTDASLSRPVALRADPVSLTIQGYSNRPGTSIDVDFEAGLGEGGRVGLRGPLTLAPLETKLAIEVEGLGIGQFQPYVDEVARLDVPGGALQAALEVAFSAASDATGAARPTIAATGRVQLDDLITIDRRLRRKFVEWSSLRVEGIDFRTGAAGEAESAAARDHVRVEEIALVGAAAHVVIGRDGRTNVDAIFGGAAEVAEAAEQLEETAARIEEVAVSEGAPPRIEIGRVLLDGVAADFDDLTLDPHFAISLDDLRGEIAGLSSDTVSRAKIQVEGRVDDVAPVRVAGQINPLSGEAYTDLAIDVTGVSLPAFTPYAGRFVGYGIDRGKLRLDLDYKLNANHLEASNVIELKQFAFGDRIQSDEATGLPVGLALAVLRDRSGDIRIPLPIEGDLDDPSFSVLGLLGQTFVNLITRVATSPFGAIAGIVGGSGEDLARVVFAPGSDRIAETERGELEQVAGLLAERPRLRLEIRGRADPQVDLPGLRRERVLRDVRLAAFQDLSRSERERVGGPDALELDAEARYEGIAALYRARKGARLRTLLPEDALPPRGLERDAALAEAGLEALAADVEVQDADWRRLARARAAAVQGAVLATGRIPAERVFLVDVEVGASGAEGQVPTELALSME